MSQAAAGGVVEICRRKTLGEFYSTSMGYFFIALGVLSCGIASLLTLAIYYALPARVWVEGGRLFSENQLDPSGLPLARIHKITLDKAFIGPYDITRVVSIFFYDDAGASLVIEVREMWFHETSETAIARLMPLVPHAKVAIHRYGPNNEPLP